MIYRSVSRRNRRAILAFLCATDSSPPLASPRGELCPFPSWEGWVQSRPALAKSGLMRSALVFRMANVSRRRVGSRLLAGKRWAKMSL